MPNEVEDACADCGRVDVTPGYVGEAGVKDHLELVRVGATASAPLATSGAVHIGSDDESRGVPGRRMCDQDEVSNGVRPSRVASSCALTDRPRAQRARRKHCDDVEIQHRIRGPDRRVLVAEEDEDGRGHP